MARVYSLDEIKEKYPDLPKEVQELITRVGKLSDDGEKLDDVLDILEKRKKLENEIGDSIFSRRVLLKEELEAVREKLSKQKKLSEIDKVSLETEKKRLELELKRNSIVKGISETFGDLSKIYGIVKQINDPFAKIDHSAANFAKSIALSAKGMEALRDTTLDNVVHNKIAARFDVSSEELINLQQNYVKAIGRNVRVSNAGQTDLAAMHSVMQGREQELITQYENFGLSLAKTGEHVGKMFADASSAGLSFEKYSDNVAKNIRIAQNYTFKNGIAGLESMAKKATALRLDMQQVAGFADKVSTVEGAITTAAQVQVLGGPFAQLADPMGMLAEGLTDMEGLYDRVTKTIGHLGQFNRETGQVEVSAFNKQRIRAYAQATGMDYSQLMESINTQSKRDEINRQIASSSAANLPEQMKELIRNSGTFENGKAGVSINGKFYSVDDLKGTQMDDLIAETRSESEDIKDIAKNLRSLVNMRSGRDKQYKDVQADALSELGQIERSVTAIEKYVNTWAYVNLAANLINAGTNVFSTFGRYPVFRWAYWKKRFKGKGNGPDGGTPISKKRLPQESVKNRSGKQPDVHLNDDKLFNGRNATKAKTVSRTVGEGKNTGKFVKAIRKTNKFLSGKGGIGAGLIASAAGMGLDMYTDNLMAKGKIQEGDNKHRTLKTGAGALEGAGIGLSVGGLAAMVPGLAAIAGTGYGIPIALAGALIGGGVALHKANKARRETALNNVVNAEGIELKGKYSSRKMKLIERAMSTGEMSDSVRRALAFEGDTDVIKKIQERQKELAEVKGDSFKVKKANIFIESATIKGKHEKGIGGSWEAIKERKDYTASAQQQTETVPKSFDININGTLKLTGDNGQSVDIISELRKNPQLLRSLADMISKELSTMKHGTNVVQRV